MRDKRATDTNSDYVILFSFPHQIGYANAPLLYLNSSLLLLFSSMLTQQLISL